MATRELLSESQRVAFERLPEMDAREMVRHYTLSEVDLAAVSLKRGSANRLRLRRPTVPAPLSGEGDASRRRDPPSR